MEGFSPSAISGGRGWGNFGKRALAPPSREDCKETGTGHGPSTQAQLPTPWGQPGVPTGPVVRAGPGSRGGERLAWPTELGLSPPGFSSPCTFVAAVSGANGSVLWERPAAQDGALVQCSVPQLQGGRTSSACVLVGRPGSFVAVDLFTGRWSPPGAPTPGRSEEVQPVFLGLADTVGKRFLGSQGGCHLLAVPLPPQPRLVTTQLHCACRPAEMGVGEPPNYTRSLRNSVP